jgi:hypothetical protein
MKVWTLLKKGNNLNYSLSSIKFNKFGRVINEKITISDNWNVGLAQIQNEEWSHVLLVDSGTVFNDWENWIEYLKTYPTKDLVGHLIWKPDDNFPKLNDQCTLISRENIDILFTNDLVNCPMPIRSKINLHDDYIPLFISGDKKQTTKFSGIIANALKKNIAIANWSKIARDKKQFLYNDKDVNNFYNSQLEYINLIENQLWVLNNEPVYILNGNKLLTVGSGLFWIMNIIQDTVNEITIKDISKAQVNFCLELLKEWNGESYGDFTYNFIKQNKIKNFQLDNVNFTKEDFLKFKKRTNFVEYVNKKFYKICDDLNIKNFKSKWNDSKNKLVSCSLDNILNVSKINYDAVWLSNADDFKWTLLHE